MHLLFSLLHAFIQKTCINIKLNIINILVIDCGKMKKQLRRNF